jgi:NhaP-type Na+/H+ or K+/H+ antiporter
MNSSEYARQLQEKVDFYLLALVFTILGLAIQTGKFGVSSKSDLLELTGWFLLTISGLIGLWRLEWLPIAHLRSGDVEVLRDSITQLKGIQANGFLKYLDTSTDAEKPISELLNYYSESLEKINRNFEKIDHQTQIKYKIHKWSFVCGVVSLVVARSIDSIAKLM